MRRVGGPGSARRAGSAQGLHGFAAGIGAWYNLTVATFGGTAPLVIQWLGDLGHSSWFFWYVALGAVVAFVAILTLPETKGSVLR